MKNIIVIITFLALVTNKVFCQITFKINFNENISEDLNFLILTDQSLQQCAEQCAERNNCQALRYRRRLHMCDLFTDYVPTAARGDSITIRRDDMQIPATFKVCDVNGVTCVKKECSSPSSLANGRYLGNINQIGSKKSIICDQGYAEVNNVTSVICETDGNWNYTPTCGEMDVCNIVDICGANEDCCKYTGGYSCVSFPVSALATETELLDLASRTEIFTTSADHATATAACNSIGANLLKLDQRWKMDYIVNIIQNCQAYQGRQFWIDGTNTNAVDYFASDAWRFHDNTVMPMDDYFWVPGKPDNAGYDHCTRITTGLRFNDYPCTAYFHYICEFP